MNKDSFNRMCEETKDQIQTLQNRCNITGEFNPANDNFPEEMNDFNERMVEKLSEE